MRGENTACCEYEVRGPDQHLLLLCSVNYSNSSSAAPHLNFHHSIFNIFSNDENRKLDLVSVPTMNRQNDVPQLKVLRIGRVSVAIRWLSIKSALSVCFLVCLAVSLVYSLPRGQPRIQSALQADSGYRIGVLLSISICSSLR